MLLSQSLKRLEKKRVGVALVWIRLERSLEDFHRLEIQPAPDEHTPVLRRHLRVREADSRPDRGLKTEFTLEPGGFGVQVTSELVRDIERPRVSGRTHHRHARAKELVRHINKCRMPIERQRFTQRSVGIVFGRVREVKPVAPRVEMIERARGRPFDQLKGLIERCTGFPAQPRLRELPPRVS